MKRQTPLKIGVSTFWWSEDNYGQLLQCYALQSFLKSMGHDPFLIRYLYKPTPRRKHPWFVHAFRAIFKPKKYIIRARQSKPERVFKKRHPEIYRELTSGDRGFEQFRQEHLSLSEKIYLHPDEVVADPPYADAYICGSDQIWCVPHDVYFLNFGPDDVKRIAYAASFGSPTLSEETKDIITPSLKRFDLITVREDSGVKLCAEMGRNDAILVQDPTLLLNKKDYERELGISTKPENTKKHILVYLIGNITDFDPSSALNYAAKNDLELKYVVSQGRLDSNANTFPSIEEWLELMRDAECILTNSFHGMIFSIIFEKRFTVIPLAPPHDRMNTRIFSLLEMLEIDGRIWSGDTSILSKEIDYTLPSKILSERKEKVEALLKEHLN